MNIKIDLNVCRICLKQPQSSIPLFDELNWHIQFKALLGIDLHPNDGLSTILCPSCYAKLKLFHDFRQKAIKSDARMKKFLNNIKTATIQQFNETFETKTEADDIELTEFGENFPEDVNTSSSLPRSRSNSFSSLISYHPEPEGLDVQQNDCESEIGLNDFVADQQQNDEEEVGTEEIETEEMKTDFIEGREQFENEDFSNLKTPEPVFQEPEKQETFKVPDIPASADLNSELDTSRKLCLKCNKQFSTKTNLLRHAKTHDGSKPFQCQVADCGAQFTQATSLKQHQLIHDGIRPYVCRVCSKTFSQSKSLRLHLLRHTGEKPHQCEYCYTSGVEVSFRQKDALKRHIAVKHPQAGGPYQKSLTCQVCHRRLQSNYALKMHSKLHFSK